MSAKAKFEIVITDAGPHLRIVGGNGEPIAITQLYRSGPSAARRAIAIIAAAVDAYRDGEQLRSVDERTPASDGGNPS